MIRISSTLADGAVRTGVACTNKAAILAKLAKLAADNYGVDAQAVLDGLNERENLGATGFGGGSAIPHTKIEGLQAPVGLFLRLEHPVPYDAVDDEPVDLVFCLISPAHDGAAHLRALAEVSRMLRDDDSCSHLRGAQDAGAVFALLTMPPERNAA
ncbi:PTS sugar transporter subunit IIA [Sphingorhabdus arenilitoris]|uniref:PTS sugar transporter subunit IIA n=1 Tax=Sphingorhabdus arenilitoris TaxID=1490041 RepID=A0ABV8RD21_9SPHN